MPREDPSQLVLEVLDEYGEAARVAIGEYLKPREPRRHLYNLVADYPRRGGRMLRPSLCIAAAKAFGADRRTAIGSAVALELLHNAFLVHDDVEDESDERRGHPTLHAMRGVPIAVNVGDALTLLSLEAFLDNRYELGVNLAMRIMEEAIGMARESVEGQAIELGWRADNALHVTAQDYLMMTLKKTCWYTTIFPLRVGALIGLGSRADLRSFIQAGFFLGAAFQIQDDLLNLTGDPIKYGKELNGDLFEGKRTLILIHLLENVTGSVREETRRILKQSRSTRTPEDVRWLREKIDELGSIDHARTMAHALTGAASHELKLLLAPLPDSRDKRFLEALPRWVLERK